MIGAIFGLISFLFAGTVSVVMFLIRRFDVTSALLVGILTQMLAKDMAWTTQMRWVIFAVMVAVCVFLEYKSHIVRLIFSIFSTLVLCFFGYVGVTYDSTTTQWIVTVCCLAAGVFLNYISWCNLEMKKMGIE